MYHAAYNYFHDDLIIDRQLRGVKRGLPITRHASQVHPLSHRTFRPAKSPFQTAGGKRPPTCGMSPHMTPRNWKRSSRATVDSASAAQVMEHHDRPGLAREPNLGWRSLRMTK